MLTEGEAITAALRYHLNAGDADVHRNQDQRERARFFLAGRLRAAWILAPWWFKRGDGQVTLSAGAATLPADFGSFGKDGHVYINGTKRDPLRYVPPDVLDYHVQNDPTPRTYPEAYTLKSRAATGAAKLATWPLNSAPLTLDLKGYHRACPEPIDVPVPPVVADGGAGVLSGSFTWRITFKTAAGETEGSELSDPPLVLSSRQATLTIPVSPVRAVTDRGIYRGTGKGTQHTRVGYVGNNLAVTYTDNVASPAGNVPTPADNNVSALALFPEDFHEFLVEALIARLMRGAEDRREDKLDALFERDAKRIWRDQKQGQNHMVIMPAYGQLSQVGPERSWRSRVAGN